MNNKTVMTPQLELMRPNLTRRRLFLDGLLVMLTAVMFSQILRARIDEQLLTHELPLLCLVVAFLLALQRLEHSAKLLLRFLTVKSRLKRLRSKMENQPSRNSI